MTRFFYGLLGLVLLAGCKVVTTDAPFIVGNETANNRAPLGTYTADSGYGQTLYVRFSPSGGMIRTMQGPQPSIAYAFGPSLSAPGNRGELLASRVPGQKGVFIWSTSAALAEVTKNGTWQADASAPNYVFLAKQQGRAFHVYGIPKGAFPAPLRAASPATALSNEGVASIADMKVVLAALDYGAMLKGDPLFVLTPDAKPSTQGLLSRNIPNARKLYEDASGIYYGAYMTFRDDIPFPSNKNDQYLYVYGERKPLEGGKIVDTTPTRVKDRSGKTVPGFRYAASEIARARQHLIPALKRTFPEDARIRKDVIFRLFLKGYHGRFNGQIYGASKGERAHLRLRFLNRDGQYKPEYEGLGKSGQPVAGFLNSAAKIKTAFPEMEPDVVTARRDNRALYLAFKDQRDQSKADRLGNILATMDKKRRPGIVYKSSAFWSQYPNFNDVQDVFDGHFDLIDHAGNFGNAYSTFARMYDAQCRQHLVNPVKRVVNTWKEDEWGLPYDGDTYHYKIDQRFYAYYDKMAELGDKKTTRNMVNEAVDGFKNGDVLAAIFNSFAAGMQSVVDYGTMRRFIADHGCLSAPVQQLLDNLVAAPLGKPAVQQTGKTYAGAAKASTPYSPADAERLFIEDRKKRVREHQAGLTPVLGDRVIRPYKVGQLANDGFRVNAALNKIGLRIQEKAHPVMTCYYGPTRRTDRGVFMFETVKYWYQSKPAEWPAFKAAAPSRDDIYPGLYHALDQCPAFLDEAKALTGPISSQW